MGLSAEQRHNPAIEYYDFVSHGMLRCDQRQMEHLAWRKIAAFLEAVECERTVEELAARTLGEIIQLFHFDYALFFVADAHNMAQNVRYAGHLHAPESLMQEYMEHYLERDPVAQLIPTFKIGYADWTRYRENEVTRDFLPRAGVTHSIGMSDLVDRFTRCGIGSQ